jgi:putative ABC transport system permease protein
MPPIFDSVGQDVRYAARTLRRSPGFAAIAIATLALGIGINTAIFSVVNAVLLRPLPYQDSDRLVRLYENVPAAGPGEARPRRLPGMNVRELLELRARSRTLSHVVSPGFAMVTASCGGEAMRLFGVPVSSGAFAMLGVQPALGRVFAPDEETTGPDAVIVLSDSAWQRCFQRDPAVLGKTVTFTGRAPGGLGGNVPLDVPFTVVGVMPPGFHYPNVGSEFWTPMVLTAPADGRVRRTTMMARLADGMSLDAAVAEISTILHELRGGPPFEPHRFELVRVRDEAVARVRPALVVLMAAVGVVLAIACANVANLLLARASGRRREIAIRIAVGAGRARLIRQVLTESVLLALAGGAAGTAFGVAGVALFRALGTNLPRFDLRTSGAFPRLDEIAVDRQALFFVLLISAATGLAFGVVPALRSSRPEASDLRGSAARRSQSVLVIVQVAMAMLLFVGAALLIRSFVNLASVDPGYDAANVVTFQIAMPGERSAPDRLRAFAEDVVARLQALPGVESAGYANQLPTVSLRDTAGGLWRTPDPRRGPPPVGPDARFVSRAYLPTMGVRLIAGRNFVEGDRSGASRVLLINETLAKREFAGESPIGQRVFISRAVEPWEVVGVVADIRQFGLDSDPEPQFFVDVRQWPENGPPLFPGGAYYAIRTKGELGPTVAAARDAVRQIDARASLDNIATMDRIVANSLAEPRLYAVLFGIFATVAIALAAIGVYGVIAYSVARRTQEIGIRMALGAAHGTVVAMVVRQGAVLTAMGVVLGLIAAAVATRFLEGMLFGVTRLDAATFAGVPLVFAAVSLTASYLPARRAASVDPLVALRRE